MSTTYDDRSRNQARMIPPQTFGLQRVVLCAPIVPAHSLEYHEHSESPIV